jgi:hypothetical protein
MLRSNGKLFGIGGGLNKVEKSFTV